MRIVARNDGADAMTDYRGSYVKSTIVAAAAAIGFGAVATGLWWGLPGYRTLTWLPALALLAATVLMGAVALGGLLALSADSRTRRRIGGTGRRGASVDGA